MRIDNRSRRGILAVTGGALLAGATSKVGYSAQITGVGQGISVGQRTVSVRPFSHPAFASEMDSLFPGMRLDSRFQSVAPFCCLITNSSEHSIKALGITWSVATATGTYQKTVEIYRHRDFQTFSGSKCLMTARLDLLTSGKSLLVSPVFSVSPEGFQVQPLSHWNSFRDELELSQFMSAEVQRATGVAMQVDAAIYDDWGVIGPDNTALARRLRVLRNAEHDEAVSALRLIKSGAGNDVVSRMLEQHQTVAGAAGQEVPTSNKFLYFYWQTRADQARILLDRLGHAGGQTFADELVVVRNQPKTIPQHLTA